MKLLKPLLFVMLAVAVSFFLVKCNDDDDSVTLLTLDGTVTYPDFNGAAQNAAGAVVYLGETEGSTSYIASAVANESGRYTFNNLTSGDYFIWANFDTKNNNLNAKVDRTIFMSEQTPVAVTAATTQDIAFTNLGQTDAEAVNTTEGGDWRSDLSHTNIDFEFPYDGENATYTGRFAEFEFTANFDPDNLAGSVITGSIDVLSIKTDSPGGRDALYDADGELWQDPDTGEYDLGCVAGTFGVSTPEDATRFATFTSSSIEPYGDGYLAKGNMNFNGRTENIDFFFKFIPGFTGTNRQGVETQFSSFEGFFDFAALADFGIESSHVVDSDVTVKISYQVTKAL